MSTPPPPSQASGFAPMRARPTWPTWPDRDAEAAADGIERRVDVEQFPRSRFAHPSQGFDPARDITVAELDGRPVAYQIARLVVDTTDGLREYRLEGGVDPACRRRGIGTRDVCRERQRR